ncbi:nucleotide exchange factor GrpE [Candidatus Microgenomates bacterium]|nr:MAG: nucleotide exchange factor GrpE [Candidatus Microgenomates bacterium]
MDSKKKKAEDNVQKTENIDQKTENGRQKTVISEQETEDREHQSEDSNEAKTKELETKLNDMTNAWKRAVADYQNLVKRTEEQKKDFIAFAVKNFLEELLPVVDDLEMAQKHVNDQGLALALKKMSTVLEQSGLTRIETVGKEYDIHTMEAIAIVDGKEDNKIVAEHRAGYLLHGSVLRPAQVTVSKKDDRK